jgi:hypothetical protein
MTNTGKALIVGLVLVDLAFVSYLMIPKDDERSKANPEAELTQSTGYAGVDPRIDDDTHVTEGSVIHAPLSAIATGKIAGGGNTAQAPAAQQPPVQAAIAQQPQPSRSPQKQAAPATRSTEVREVYAAKNPAPQTTRAYDDPGRHGSNPVAAALTQQLVEESAKPDPSLPMPTAPMPSMQLSQPARSAPDYQTRHGSNPVAAAMTQQLVNESAKPDPSLPMPSPAQRPPIYQDGSHGSNAIGAAMTQDLVRQSATVSPSSQQAPRSGTQ